MAKKMNLWSLNFAIMCIVLFFIISLSGPIDYSIMGTHPLNLVLYSTLLTFVLGIVGFSGIQDWKGIARSMATVIITACLSAFLIFVIIFGGLLS